MAVIYLITNTTNNKQYVGYTKYSAEFRFKQHCIESNSALSYSILHDAINKYGASNFTVEVLESSDDAEHLHFVRERYWIREKGTMSPHGYNVQEGGEGNRNPNSRRACELYDSELNLVKSFDSVTELALHLRIPHARVYIACTNASKGKSSSLLKKNFYVCFQGETPRKKDTSYLVEHNRMLAANNTSKKRPEHSEFMKHYNKQKKT